MRNLQKQKVKASSAWFMRLKGRRCLHNIKIQGEAASAIQAAIQKAQLR